MLEGREYCGNVNGRSPTMESMKASSSSATLLSSSSSSSSSSPSKYIEHHVTNLDTLAGVAIKYGVEIVDIKRLNGMVSDLQMFARRTILIPLPGRHPPSSSLSTDHIATRPTSRRARSDILDSFPSLSTISERKVSPAMSNLQGYYGLNGEESTSHQDEAIKKRLCRRSQSMANFQKLEKDHEFTFDVRKHAQKWTDKNTRTPEKVLKDENCSGSWYSAITGKGLALRKTPSRTTFVYDNGDNGGRVNGVITMLANSFANVSLSGVRKCSSTPSFQDQESNNCSIWSPSKWSLGSDLQAAFDGLAKPIGGVRVKTALD